MNNLFTMIVLVESTVYAYNYRLIVAEWHNFYIEFIGDAAYLKAVGLIADSLIVFDVI